MLYFPDITYLSNPCNKYSLEINKSNVELKKEEKEGLSRDIGMPNLVTVYEIILNKQNTVIKYLLLYIQ
jgi:hypothetical protein